MSGRERSNAIRSSNSIIVSRQSTMYNEVTRPRSLSKSYHDNANTYNLIVPYIKTRKSKSKVGINKKK